MLSELPHKSLYACTKQRCCCIQTACSEPNKAVAAKRPSAGSAAAQRLQCDRQFASKKQKDALVRCSAVQPSSSEELSAGRAEAEQVCVWVVDRVDCTFLGLVFSRCDGHASLPAPQARSLHHAQSIMHLP